jgi:hypothetical protein
MGNRITNGQIHRHHTQINDLIYSHTAISENVLEREPLFLYSRRINRHSVCVTNTAVNELDGKLASRVQMYELVIGLTQNVISHIGGGKERMNKR